MSVRTERVASVIKAELGTFFQREFPMENFGFLTVTEVRVTPDLRQAKVFISVFGDADRKKRSMQMLEDRKPEIRSALGRAVRLRFLPELVFMLDETIDRAMSIEKLLKQIQDERDARDAGGQNGAPGA
ncbi:MAG: 30S ribosome-binding factor RbfA [Bacteroidetes bacterium]|jgi:ribosome-binding factor A|nr:30S ribosome-binding factor RbfA [Bacteroidota bacterium]